MAIASLHNVSVLSSSFLKESRSEAVRRRGDEGGEAPGHRHTCKHSRSLRMSICHINDRKCNDHGGSSEGGGSECK
ncbi:hypothetical protein D5086_016080 [Populus alba]|uniref:Uncharacterized protein n=1 Tax=Populus alba TaxID=43335 RepID=A0ACC4BV26_POPAL